MIQTFDVQGGPDIGRTNLPRLRAQMKAQSLDGLYIPHADAYQNEYLPEGSDRLAWATGFTGSAGAAFVFIKSAIVFVDGRYTLQAKSQLDAKLFASTDLHEPGPFKWLGSQTFRAARIGYDPHLVTPDDLDSLQLAADRAGAELVAVEENPVDLAWPNRPDEPRQPVVPHDISFCGETHAEKRARIAAALRESGADATVVVSPASIAWLFNIRGGDVKCTPLPLGRAILHADGTAELLLRPEKVTDSLQTHLGTDVVLRPINELERRLKKLAGKTISLDPALASAWFFNTMASAGCPIIREGDPIALPRACKNKVEIEGSARAHQRDGAALVRYLMWLDSDEGQSGEVDEITAASRLEKDRMEGQGLKDLSFESISGAGPNGAIVHYRVNTATNRKLETGSLFLIDSGGQYLDGTTDVTRTIAIGQPTDEMRERYTLVLKGHIALSTVRFPVGTTGSALDVIARHALWMEGLDYDHGTGHGVGSYLGVHEGPQRIAKAPNTVALQPGMIVSNEPGYYKTNAYGIRIENLQYVTEASDIRGGDRPMLGFKTLTLAPLDKKLIVPGLLTPAEWRWVDDYHARVLEELSPRLGSVEIEWLTRACAPLEG